MLPNIALCVRMIILALHLHRPMQGNGHCLVRPAACYVAHVCHMSAAAMLFLHSPLDSRMLLKACICCWWLQTVDL